MPRIDGDAAASHVQGKGIAGLRRRTEQHQRRKVGKSFHPTLPCCPRRKLFDTESLDCDPSHALRACEHVRRRGEPAEVSEADALVGTLPCPLESSRPRYVASRFSSCANNRCLRVHFAFSNGRLISIPFWRITPGHIVTFHRLVLAIDSEHSSRVSALERALRSRNRLLEVRNFDDHWCDAIERETAELAVAVAATRGQTAMKLAAMLRSLGAWNHSRLLLRRGQIEQ